MTTETQDEVRYYTPEEVAEKLKVGVRTVYGWLQSGQLSAGRAGRQWRVTEEDIRRFVESGRPQK